MEWNKELVIQKLEMKNTQLEIIAEGDIVTGVSMDLKPKLQIYGLMQTLGEQMLNLNLVQQ